MIYINPEGQYPRHIGDIQLEHPTFQEGDELPEGWVKVEETARPTTEQNEIAYEGQPVEIDGVMTQNWVVRAMTQQEIDKRDAPRRAKEKLMALGLTEDEALAIVGA